ncbi:glucan 1,3-alpha-glucosidase [Brevibacillus agri]|uniref:Glucan 1,3-alpha-glucosidase n=1 Tax=Brevibacillus agri TaxID=51101 RepID=A0A3M8AZW9_9BACL|nr:MULTISPECIES: glycoside hydrolase family 15 protein [Brevibacillus]EJL42448.1 glycosyl hydrolase, glucoamylase [Brevibacillus sp. CF112]MBG9565000.1 glycoside hydrolase family 15 [Brevibacillus agri]MBY0051198.1 glycoside hydrolase family 15 protein [Brevibacillus agri]MCG5250409.1 glycoside hydrolase family 15 protein [Brevibacillus agri]MDN4093162.1 glycoside hydrolase family 15 protein [Brevibacillus agri]
MPRPLVVGNGKLLINFDDRLHMRDLYYPYVGQLNHVGGHFSKLGIWVQGRFSWLDEDGWKRQLGYDRESLVTDVHAHHEHLAVSLQMADGVHQRDPIYLKKVCVRNHANEAREIRLFFNHDFSLNETEVGDTAVYDPILSTVYHYKRNVYMMANGKTPEGGIDQFSVGIKRFNYAEGTWRDAEDGLLAGNPIAQGSVDSTISFRLLLQPHEEKTMYYWLCVGDSYDAVRTLNQYVLDNDPDRLLGRVAVYWRRWVNKEERDFADLPPEVVHLYKTSLLLVRTQIDQNGAILAANDSDILQFNRDHYSYMWPRDGALIASAMAKAGYTGTVAPFFTFCAQALNEDGYLQHKYNPDGSVGSSWHPYVVDGEVQLPIQEDETALVLYALWEQYKSGKQIEDCQALYATLVRPAARFLLEYVHPTLELPKPSYDLWEERRGIFTFTSATVYAGLMAAARFAQLFGDDRRHKRYEDGAKSIRAAMEKHLYDPGIGRFLRGIYLRPDGGVEKDFTVESSLYALFALEVFPVDDPRVQRTMEAVKKSLRVDTEVGGFARYQGDYYFKKSHDIARVPGNPWIICTLWVADWEIAKAKSLEELQEPKNRLLWVVRHSLQSGVLSEQLDPYSGAPVSVAPLTWSHATFVATVLRYLEKVNELR